MYGLFCPARIVPVGTANNGQSCDSLKVIILSCADMEMEKQSNQLVVFTEAIPFLQCNSGTRLLLE
jgi:hypothetical protein